MARQYFCIYPDLEILTNNHVSSFKATDLKILTLTNSLSNVCVIQVWIITSYTNWRVS